MVKLDCIMDFDYSLMSNGTRHHIPKTDCPDCDEQFALFTELIPEEWDSKFLSPLSP